MARPGELDRRIRLERANPNEDEMGGVADGGFTPLSTVWARKQDLGVSESFKADERAGTLVSLFVVRSSELTRSLTTQDQIVYRDEGYEITGIRETKEGRNNYLEIQTVVRTDGAQ